MRSLRKYSFLEVLVVWVLFCVTILGCEEELPDIEIPQFRSPQDVALVCFDPNTGLSSPIDSCKNSERSDAEIYAFVTQIEPGEVAVVNLEDYKIIDQEERIPFNSFVPVGGSPQDIVASHDGATVYTANLETRDISVVDVQAAILGTPDASPGANGKETYTRVLFPAQSIDVRYPAAQIVIAEDVVGSTSGTSDIQDKFAFVTQPTVGRVAVVNLEAYEYITADGKIAVVPPGVLAYLRLDDGTLSDEQDDRPGGVVPWSMVASTRISSLFVGGRQGGVNRDDGSYIVEIQREIFIDRAKRSFENHRKVLPLEPAEMIVRRIELQEFTVLDMSIEPELERWMYIVENEKGGVVVLDMESGELLAINSWDINASDNYSLDVPGIVKKVKLARFAETPEYEMPDPFTFNGTVALVSTTESGIFVVDVAVDDAMSAKIGNYTSYPHSLRSATAWYEPPDDDDVQEVVYPAVRDEVTLYADEESLQYEEPFEALAEKDTDSDSSTPKVEDGCVEDPSGFRMVQTDDSQNVYFRCDRRMSTTEVWLLKYQGAVDISGAATLENTDIPNTVVMTDRTKEFCTRGLLGPAGEDIWGAYPVGTDAGPYERFRYYQGDIVEITEDPSPLMPGDQSVDCSVYKDEDLKKWYRVTEIIGDNAVRLVALGGPAAGFAPLPTEACYGQAFTYTVRANSSWVLRGGETGLLFEGMTQNGHCVPWTENSSTHWKNSRVFEPRNSDPSDTDSTQSISFDFENTFLKFRLNSVTDLGRADASKDSYDNLYFKFATISGFSPMFHAIGADITDIEIAPNNDIVLIDKSSRGMVLFDLIDTFAVISEPIN